MATEPTYNEEMERVELHAVALRPMLDTAREELGEQNVTEILESMGVSEERVYASNAWMSKAFVEAFMQEMVDRTGDPAIIDRYSARMVSPRYMGFFYPLMRAFGNTETAYEWVVKATPRFDKTSRYFVKERRPGFISLERRPVPGYPDDRSLYSCRSREVQLSRVPTLFGLPPARVEHPLCSVRGDGVCLFRISWQVARKSVERWLGFLSGVALGVLVALLFRVDSGLSSFLVVVSALAGWAIGNSFGLRRNVDERVAYIAEQQDALHQSMRANEERFAELMQAKAGVEEQVEVRTAELRETSRRLAETLERAEELARAKSDFFSNVSHDLRTPLTLISGPLEELLAGREPPGGTAAAIESMHRNVGWLLRLINQLLDLARVDAGRVELRRTAVDLGSLARTVVESFVPAARARGVELSLQAPERTEPCALDPAWIESMLGNLISNALRYAEEGGWVRVRVEEEGEWFRIEVEDSGKGIAPEDLPSVFERFVQGRGSDRRKGGAGIGLALVREAARLHGGDAEVRSDPGKGALFTVTLPVVKMGEDAVEQEAAGQKAAATESGRAGRRSRVRLFSSAGDELLSDPSQIDVDADRPGPSPEAPLVLVVEDHADTRRFVADVLSESYRVKGAADGEEGLRLALEINPDAVVTDIDMPKMNGMELCRALRGREETSSIPIILLTALRGTGQVLGGFEAGADDFVEKPFHGRELLARVDAHIRLRQAISQIAHNSRLAMLGQTAASVAHQIRNPLNVVYSGLQSLHGRIERTSDPRTAQMLGVMLDSAARINQITDDLMNVSRLNRASRERFRVADGLTSCSRLIRARLPRGVTLEEAIDEGAMLEGRPSDLNQVFLNLLDNALRAVGEQGRIELRSLQRDGHVYVSVADSGPGVEESDRERIFKPFFTTRRAGEGTGLGLSIAWQVVNQHGGDISVGRSELGGALFTVRIPIANGAS